MPADLELLRWVVERLGAPMLLAAVVGYFYRRDVLSQRDRAREDAEAALKREDRLLKVMERHAAATERLAGAAEALRDVFRDSHEALSTQFGQMKHDVMNSLNNLNLRCLEAVKREHVA